MRCLPDADAHGGSPSSGLPTAPLAQQRGDTTVDHDGGLRGAPTARTAVIGPSIDYNKSTYRE
jgi:hypothetical protein